MIFDTHEMKKLIQNFEGQSDALVPNIVYLGRSESMAIERDYLENLIKLAPKFKQKDWIRRLMKEEAGQHIGAWFEMMLYGWLSDLGHVDVEPELEGNYPDFSLIVEGQKIVVEAKACVTNNALVKRDLLISEVLQMLSKINRPFYIYINEKSTFETSPDFITFRNEVTNWLDSSPEEHFLFKDAKGNKIRLESNRDDSLERVHCLGPINAGSSDPKIFRVSLNKKAGQHKAIRKANYPYVIAIMLDSPQLFVTQAVDAWFGKKQLILDPGCTKIVESRFDQSGLHFIGSNILHKSVSGTLAFVPRWEENRQRRFLQAHYIQNPYANVRLSPDLFPARSKFIVINQDYSGVSMGWQ
jgi:hypothetical protein